MSSTQPPNYVEPKYLLSDIPHLESGWAVDQAIVTEDRLVCIRFGVPEADEVILMDRTLAKIQRRVINFCVIYAVDIEQVPDFNDLYGLSNDSLSVIWFFKNRHIPVDFRTGDNNKLSQHIPDTDVMIELLNKIYIGVQRKSGTIDSGINFSSRYSY